MSEKVINQLIRRQLFTIISLIVIILYVAVVAA